MIRQTTVIQSAKAQRMVYFQVGLLTAAMIMLVSPAWSLIIVFLLGLYQVGLSLYFLMLRSRVTQGLKKRLLIYRMGVAIYIPSYVAIVNKRGTFQGDGDWGYSAGLVMAALALSILMIWITIASGKEEWSIPGTVSRPDILDA